MIDPTTYAFRIVQCLWATQKVEKTHFHRDMQLALLKDLEKVYVYRPGHAHIIYVSSICNNVCVGEVRVTLDVLTCISVS